MKLYKGDRQLTTTEMDAIHAIREGTAIRVTISPFLTTHMVAIWAVLLSLKALGDKAKEWKILPETLDFLAINLTNHWEDWASPSIVMRPWMVENTTL